MGGPLPMVESRRDVDPQQVPQVGVATSRIETRRFVRGAGTYVDDMQLDGMVHAVFVRSPIAHARIVRVDCTAARKLPGVFAVFSGDDLSDAMRRGRGTGSALVADLETDYLARSKAVHCGQAVAVAVAETPYLAQDAADLVEIDFEPLPTITDPEAAMREDSPRVFEQLPSGNVVQELHFSTRDLEETFAAADLVVRERLRSHRFAACPLEPNVALAQYDARHAGLTVWVATAGVHGVRRTIANALGLGEGSVRVVAPDVGGSFGAKNGTYPEVVVVAALSRRLGRPVKWLETRVEHLAAAAHGRDQIHDVEIAVTSDGRILGLRDRIVADLGAASSVDNSVSSAVLYMTGAYDIKSYQVDAYGVATNKSRHGSLRGIGKAEAALTIERLIDIVARQLGQDPAEMRLRNLVPETSFPYRTATGAVLDSGRYTECLRQVLDTAHYTELREQQARAREAGALRGIGISFVIEPTSAARRRVGGGYGACRIRMEPSGRVCVFPSLGQQGQGHVTTITQIVCDVLRVTADQVDVFESDTSTSPFGFGTGSSRSSVTLMPAVHVASNQLREKLIRIASHQFEADPVDIVVEGGQLRVAGTARPSISFQRVAEIAYNDIDQLPPGVEPALEVTGYFTNPNISYERDELGRHNEFAAYPYEAVVAVVEVDRATGSVSILSYFSVHDCGRVLNPTIVRTQHLGCIAQGIGGAMYEELNYDEDGLLINSTFMDYLMPTVNEIPELTLGHLETPTPFTPLGAKGAGETGTLSPPAALGNAIEDALSPLGVKLRKTPYTADRLRRLIRAAEGETSGVTEVGAWRHA